MIREHEKYHGAALCVLLGAWAGAVKLKRVHTSGGAAYQVNDDAVLYLKYSTARMSPWSFTFHPSHWSALEELTKQYAACVIGLVCSFDGIAGVTLSDLMSIRGTRDKQLATVSVKREPGRLYAVSSERVPLPHKIAQGDFVNKLRDAKVSIRLDKRLPWVMPVSNDR